MSVQNIGASICNRLLDKARAENLDFNLLLTRYALERMLYRLSISTQHDQFLLKGALLFGRGSISPASSRNPTQLSSRVTGQTCRESGSHG
jgi:hypothetical protein